MIIPGIPCNKRGEYLPPYTHPPPAAAPNADDANPWNPFNSQVEFDFAHYHFVEVQNSAGKIDQALDLCSWKDSAELYATIDAIQHGDSPWKVYKIRYKGPRPPGTPPKWMTETYELCTRDSCQVLHHQLSMAEFKDKFNVAPYRQVNGEGVRTWSNLMSADWAWKQVDTIAEDESTHSAMFVPVVAGSDKMTVSVATGHQEYHPVYMSPGNLTNVARQAHGNALLPVAFLLIPKTSKKHRKTAKYQKFCRQMYHASGMTTPEVVRCLDGHFRMAVYGLVWLASIVQGWCPKCNAPPDHLNRPNSHRWTHGKTDFLISAWDPGTLWSDFGIPIHSQISSADIHELLTPDLLHQVIKGTFKDHIIMWINQYLVEEYGEARAHEIIADIDHWISAVPPFPGLRRFPDGHDFTQWTGDDSKALMKVYLAAIAGHVPSEMVKCLAAFLDFCYIVWRNAITAEDLVELQHTLDRFHTHCEVFIGTAGVTGERISLPHQHSLMHYIRCIILFSSPNGLCSSITESKHIKAVKEPWRRSSRFKALKQMLVTISQMDKLSTASRAHTELGMMDGTTSLYTAMIQRGEKPQPRTAAADEEEDDDDNGPVPGPNPAQGYPCRAEALANHIGEPQFVELLQRFLYEQVNPNTATLPEDVPLNECPSFVGSISVFHSAIARFYAPSDLCGAGGMYHERIHSNPNWRREYACYDTMFVETNSELDGMPGMAIGRAHLFFLFKFRGKQYSFPYNKPDEDTGMWVVRPEFQGNRHRTLSIIPLDCVARAAHLLPVYGSSFLPEDFHFADSLDVFLAYFVNPYIDHHSNEFLK
ncbi:hypothetical protein BJV74DRAFT_900472 [Russula compacta]|nr:hypothetical protein BJV74DRAFT_900472 [Russula compacta]